MIPSSDSRQLLALTLERYQKGQVLQAQQLCQQIIKQQPSQVDALNLLGIITCQLGQVEQGIAYLQQAIAHQPNFSDAHFNLGNVLQHQGKLEEAIAHYQEALASQPDFAETYLNLGRCLEQESRFEEAIAVYQKLIAFKPDIPGTYLNLGLALQGQGKFQEAIGAYNHVLELEPNSDRAYNNLGLTFKDQGQLKEAIGSFNRAIELNPQDAGMRLNRATTLLLSGDFCRGFAEYESRWQHFESLGAQIYPFTQPLWDGKDLNGQIILLHSEQGFGDAIQFVRYAPLVQQRGGRVIVGCRASLLRLFSTVSGIDRLVAMGGCMPEFQLHAPLMSLPHLLGTTLETVPAQVPYLFALHSHPKLDAPPNGRKKVGIVWAAGEVGGKDKLRSIQTKRSCALTEFMKILEIPGLAFYSLQKGPQATDLEQLQGQVSVQDLSGQIRNFADTAAAIAQLDLVITVDTAVAHLAGALGQPVWVLLPFSPDWRWMLERDDSPWYPTMRLFRQERPGDWGGVFTRVAQALQQSRSPNERLSK